MHVFCSAIQGSMNYVTDNVKIMDSKTRQLSMRNFEFIHEVCKQPALAVKKNLLLSPYSIDAAMSMVYVGARAETADEMKTVMKLNADPEDSKHYAAFEALLDRLQKQHGKGVSLHSANKLYLQQDFETEPKYLQILQQHYRSSLGIVDFRNESEKTRTDINKWVEETTQQKIKDLLPSGVIDEMTRLVLVNALYFKGNWDKKFQNKFTKKADFHVNASTTIQVDMMYQKGYFNLCYSDDLACEALELPYVNKNLRMLIFLPNDKDGVDVMTSKLNYAALEKLINLMQKQEIMVFLPKFKLECAMSLGDTFSQMGMKSLFAEGKADLSGICSTRNLHVSAVVHKTFVEVNEEGTEAAAATAVEIMSDCMPPSFHVDHPFVFMIQEKSSGIILFWGKVKDPSTE